MTAQPFIDVHTHVMPLPFLRALAADGLADLDGLGEHVVRIAPEVSGLPMTAPIPCPPAQYDLDARLSTLDSAGVDVHVVSAPPFLFAARQDDQRRVFGLLRALNEAIVEFAAAAPGRLVPLGTVAVGHRGAAAEARHCMEELGCAGIALGTHGAGKELDHPDNDELWDYLAAHEVFVLLHPGASAADARLGDYHLTQLLGFPVDTATAVARLIFGTVLDRYDPLICLCHGGGCAPALAPRWDLGWRRKAVAGTSRQPPSAYLSRFCYDTAVFDIPTLRLLVDRMGADRVLLGTDSPFDLADQRPRATVAALGLNDEDERRIAGGNAARLLGGRLLEPTT
ncbi:amidohydrolase family protein [Pseudonocardia acaciae]|uniref:amidohydrolase family protein n=1 Tax=Pseudonocardia acaciae TaxID=551276 RepID=UPI000A4CB68C|nr:amidohydrolase family protein [Pseudonocardia acaciae]